MQTFPVPTSRVLRDLLDEAPRDAVTLDWIMERLDERSFGLIMLVLALLALALAAAFASLAATAVTVWAMVHGITVLEELP